MRSFLNEDDRRTLLATYPLPAIHSPTLAQAVRSRSSRSRRPAQSSSPSPDNAHFELLESLGDTLITAAIGRAVYHHLRDREGSASPALFSSYRTLLQSNYAFAQLTTAYELPPTLNPPLAVAFSDRENLPPSAIKALGDAFEAYVGGLYADGQRSGVEEWLEALMSWCCCRAEAAVEPLLRDGDMRLLKTAEPLDAFQHAISPPPSSLSSPSALPGPAETPSTLDCACWKRSLSAAVKSLGTRYDIRAEASFQTRLVFPDGQFFTAAAPTKKLAENTAARLALLALDPTAAALVQHHCGQHSAGS